MAERSGCLLALGWFIALGMYFVQACVLLKFLEEHTKSELYWIGVVLYVALAVAVVIVACRAGYAETDEEVFVVWLFWFIYIVLYTTTVALIFDKIADKLDKSKTYGPNFLKSMLCITPALLVLMLQLAISPSYRKGVLALSIFGALNLFDGIEMLEIILMQKDLKDFDLDGSIETCIIGFACASFIVTSLGFITRNEFKSDDTVEERGNGGAVCLGFLEILLTNVPFLGLRIYVWAACGYEASIFIAKNIVSLVVGLIDFCIAIKCCTCE